MYRWVLLSTKRTPITNLILFMFLFQGALDVLIPMASTIETFPVVFKLLATLRMIIDGQTEAAVKVMAKKFAVV